MRFLTNQECEQWLHGRERRKPNEVPGARSVRISYPPEPYRIRFFAHWTATTLTRQEGALLWITEWGIWPSSENWHLYDRLRHTYGDLCQLHEAPGHLFMDYEAEDLASFLQIAMLNGWGGYLLTTRNDVNAFFSHDEYIDFFAAREDDLAEVIKMLGPTPAPNPSTVKKQPARKRRRGK